MTRLQNYIQFILELFWAIRWLFLYKLSRTDWRAAKSFQHRHRSGLEEQHASDRQVDDLIAVKKWWWFSRSLVDSVLKEHPLSFVKGNFLLSDPIVTFVIPYMDSGQNRQKSLFFSIQSIAGEFGGMARVVIVEQGENISLLSICNEFPEGFVKIHLLKRKKGDLFERAAALNLGVKRSITEWVVLHDLDICISQGYREFVNKINVSNYEVAWPLLTALFLDDQQTARLPDKQPQIAMSCCRELESLSLLIRRAAYWKIGGMNESFKGWGCEDNEFYDRASSLIIKPVRELVAFHCWHPLADKRSSAANTNRKTLHGLRLQPIEKRILDLRKNCEIPTVQDYIG